MQKIEDVKNKIEEYLKSDNTFDYVLKRNPTLYKARLESLFSKEELDSISNIENNYCFKCEPSCVEFIGQPIKLETFKPNGKYEYIYISNFKYNGFIYRTDSRDDIPKKIEIEGIIKVLTTRFVEPEHNKNAIIKPPELIDVLDNNAIEVWDRNQKNQKLANNKYI